MAMAMAGGEELVAAASDIGERMAAAQERVKQLREALELAVLARDELVVEARETHALSFREIERRSTIPHSTVVSIMART